MKVNEIKFENDNKDNFIHRCVFNRCSYDDEYKRKLYSIIHNSNTVDEFIDTYLNTKEFSKEQAYAVLSAQCRPNDNWYRIREMFGDKCFKTSSEAGSVKVGNESFSVLIPNGYGDGCTRVAVFKKDEWNNNFLDFFTSIQGENICIYSFDCGDTVCKKLEGKRYGVYQKEGFVAFEEWN